MTSLVYTVPYITGYMGTNTSWGTFWRNYEFIIAPQDKCSILKLVLCCFC